jgi:hypothetical protein
MHSLNTLLLQYPRRLPLDFFQRNYRLDWYPKARSSLRFLVDRVWVESLFLNAFRHFFPNTWRTRPHRVLSTLLNIKLVPWLGQDFDHSLKHTLPPLRLDPLFILFQRQIRQS